MSLKLLLLNHTGIKKKKKKNKYRSRCGILPKCQKIVSVNL